MTHPAWFAPPADAPTPVRLDALMHYWLGQRAGTVAAKTLVYCSEGSPENFNPQLYTSGTSVDASAVPVYNRLVDFKPGTTELVPSLAER